MRVIDMFGPLPKPVYRPKRDLPELLRQLREDSVEWDSPNLPNPPGNLQCVQYACEVKGGGRGDFFVRISHEGRVCPEGQSNWPVITHSGAWVGIRCGWWSTQEEAEKALSAAIARVFPDLIAAEEEKRKKRESLKRQGATIAEDVLASARTIPAIVAAGRAAGYQMDVEMINDPYCGRDLDPEREEDRLQKGWLCHPKVTAIAPNEGPRKMWLWTGQDWFKFGSDGKRRKTPPWEE